ncbi:MAG: ABC transporter permease [Planctomycetes bacterium]|nr:ABC transporter permease [Planctomycetota bacterium]
MNEKRHTFRWAAWLGWQLDSNWTEPWLFIIYVLIKPVTSSLLLVCMYYAARTATQGAVPIEFLPYIYVSNACYMLVGAVMFGMSYAVISDREHYRMLKYIYISPGHLRTYFVGRALSGAAQALLGGVLNVGIGMIAFPEVRNALLRQPTEWGWLGFHLLVGTVLLISLGLILSAAVLNMARQGMFLSEGIAGILYLLCGVVFPLAVLPKFLQTVSLLLPPTYWLEGMRRALLGSSPEKMLLGPLSNWEQPQLGMALLASTIVLTTFAGWFFHWSERRAWRLGRIEETTGA